MSDDLISREAMSNALNTIRVGKNETWYSFYQKVLDELCKLPSVEPERKKGKWIEKNHTYSGECPIDQWQSCKCSECGRYDTRPYLYYFVEPKFCSWCGAEMREEKEEEK